MQRTALFIVIAACGLLTPGCGRPFNEQIDLVGTAPLPALSATSDTTSLSGTPSLTGLDRRSWPVVTVQVPKQQVAHYRTYVSNLKLQSDGGPWDEQFPTAVTAFDDTSDAGADALDGVVEPLWAAALLVWAPIDMVILWHWPWNEVRSPAEPYARVPGTGKKEIWSWVDAAAARTMQIQWTDEGAAAKEPQ
ncbi:MAG: hypothetical protein ACYSU7_12750 [Planctomycetota bacterium]|jgi:hypothetical protein